MSAWRRQLLPFGCLLVLPACAQWLLGADDGPGSSMAEPDAQVIAAPSEAGPSSPDAAPATQGDAAGCAGNQKRCSGQCVGADSVVFGCASLGCEPCALPHAVAKCGQAGACAIANCEAGFDDCDGQAANGCEASINTKEHCGTCTRQCLGASEICSQGECVTQCEAPLQKCGTSCVSTASDVSHCGTCGRSCTAPLGGTTSCQAGECAPLCAGALPLRCGSVCVDPVSDKANCGTCGRACTGPNEVCASSQCKVQCGAGLSVCGAACADLQTDGQNCGVCGRKCTAPTGGTTSCAAGMCAPKCAGALPTLCGQSCVNTQTDSAHCGTCGNALAAGFVCINGVPACSTGAAPVGGQCPSWKRVNSGTTDSLHALWGSSANNVFAGGGTNTLLNWRGASWAPVAGAPAAGIGALWGSSATDLWVGGVSGVWRQNGTSWTQISIAQVYGLSGTSVSDVWAVGASGARGMTEHWSGGSWTTPSSAAVSRFEAVWALSPTEAYVVGPDSTILRWSGTGWFRFNNGLSSGAVQGIWGLASDDLWAVGQWGHTYHRTTNVWSEVRSTFWGSGTEFYAVGGTSKNDVWVVGTGGVILHWNGSSWLQTPSGTTEELLALWAVSPEDVWASGTGGTLLHYSLH